MTLSQPFIFLFIFIFISSLSIFIYYFFLKKQINEKPKTKGEHYFQSSFGSIYYETKGTDGPALLFIHGIGSSIFCWRKLTPYLEKDFHLILPDLWGFGKSSKENLGQMNIDTQVQVLIELMDHLKIEKFHILGHSLGGHLSFWLTRNFSSRVEKVVTIAPPTHSLALPRTITKNLWVSRVTPFIMNKFILKKILTNIISNRSFINDELIDAYFMPYFDPKAHQSFSKSIPMIDDQRVFNELSKIKCPVLLMYGLKDKVIKRRVIEDIHKKLPDCLLSTSEFSNHLPMEDDVLWLKENILTFLKSGTDLEIV